VSVTDGVTVPPFGTSSVRVTVAPVSSRSCNESNVLHLRLLMSPSSVDADESSVTAFPYTTGLGEAVSFTCGASLKRQKNASKKGIPVHRPSQPLRPSVIAAPMNSTVARRPKDGLLTAQVCRERRPRRTGRPDRMRRR
jgi:hypothetical protein